MRPVKREYTQEPHCCLSPDSEPLLRMELEDGGGGEYLVLHAQHWALDSVEEVDRLADALKDLLIQAKGASA